jgi:hypothetical protein
MRAALPRAQALATAVHVDGTINDHSDRDRGWAVELRIPWASLEPLGTKEAPPAEDPGGWARSPHGVWDRERRGR